MTTFFDTQRRETNSAAVDIKTCVLTADCDLQEWTCVWLKEERIFTSVSKHLILNKHFPFLNYSVASFLQLFSVPIMHNNHEVQTKNLAVCVLPLNLHLFCFTEFHSCFFVQPVTSVSHSQQFSVVTFIVAPCISMIQSLLYTNLCTYIYIINH
jgi:hypothetical protein